jgi:hypothetical protein
VAEPGAHSLEYWSMDQAGNVELSRNWVYFTVSEDTEPPSTTSDARASYTFGGTITLTATDNSTLGVKNTYYRLNDGPTETGTKIEIPATNGTVEYTLTFWSEDWSGNIETAKSVNFTVNSDSGTIRLVWRNSDVTGSPCTSDPEAKARWTVRVDNWWGRIVRSGSDGCPNWSGVNDMTFAIGPTEYLVIVEWWDSEWDSYTDEDGHFKVKVTTPGEVIRLSY